MSPERGPGRTDGALKRLRDLRRRGRAPPERFHLLLDAMEECGKIRNFQCEVERACDIHVAFQLPGGEPLSCILIRKGRVVRHSGSEDGATRVVLPPATAARALTGHPAAVLNHAYYTGEARVEGDVPGFMCLLALFECLVPYLEGGARD